CAEVVRLELDLNACPLPLTLQRDDELIRDESSQRAKGYPQSAELRHKSPCLLQIVHPVAGDGIVMEEAAVGRERLADGIAVAEQPVSNGAHVRRIVDCLTSAQVVERRDGGVQLDYARRCRRLRRYLDASIMLGRLDEGCGRHSFIGLRIPGDECL